MHQQSQNTFSIHKQYTPSMSIKPLNTQLTSFNTNSFLNASSSSSIQMHCYPHQHSEHAPSSPSNVDHKIRMVSSPEVKINLDNIDTCLPSFFPKNLSQQTSTSTSTESLLTTTNASSYQFPQYTTMNSVFRSYENLIHNQSERFHSNFPLQYTTHLIQQQRRQFSMSNIIPPQSNAFSLSTKMISKANNNNTKVNKCYYNKFNSPHENSHNENTLILTLKIKISQSDYRVFYLKKFDDLFISIQRFVEMNQIKQEIVKPIVSKIFHALNKVFWVLNSKIGRYDQKYLSSVYKVWLKNKDKIIFNKKQIQIDNKHSTTYKDNKSQYIMNTYTEGYTVRHSVKHSKHIHNVSY